MPGFNQRGRGRGRGGYRGGYQSVSTMPLPTLPSSPIRVTDSPRLAFAARRILAVCSWTGTRSRSRRVVVAPGTRARLSLCCTRRNGRHARPSLKILELSSLLSPVLAVPDCLSVGVSMPPGLSLGVESREWRHEQADLSSNATATQPDPLGWIRRAALENLHARSSPSFHFRDKLDRGYR